MFFAYSRRIAPTEAHVIGSSVSHFKVTSKLKGLVISDFAITGRSGERYTDWAPGIWNTRASMLRRSWVPVRNMKWMSFHMPTNMIASRPSP